MWNHILLKMNFIDPSNYKPLWHIVAAYIGPVLLKSSPFSLQWRDWSCWYWTCHLSFNQVGIDILMKFKMAASMDDMKKLTKKRDEIESEIKALHEVLDSVWQYFIVVVYKREVYKRHKWHF